MSMEDYLRQPMKFEAKQEPIEVDVQIGEDNYKLKPASAGSVVKYRNKQTDGLALDDGKVVGIRGIAESEPLLVSLCLFDSRDMPVPLKVINTWEPTIVKELHDRAKLISGINEKSSEREALEKALGLEGSPCTPQQLSEFVQSLPDEEYKTLKLWLYTVEDKEDLVKN